MHVIVPMAGHSRRFQNAGYLVPKWLLPVGHESMIAHVVSLFSENDTFHLIINTEQEDQNLELVKQLRSLAPNVHIQVIDTHDIGPLHTAMMVEGINDEEPIIVSYCDFIVSWDYRNFLDHVYGSDGAIAFFRGFHPASFGSTYYAYMRIQKDRMLELREKASFTEQRELEPASVGIYYFSTFGIFRRYAKGVLSQPDSLLQEMYVSLLFNPMVDAGLSVVTHEVEKFVCLGTPEDYEQYQYWFKYFSSEGALISQPTKANKKAKSVNLLPIAGRGSRFRNYGYRAAKPLIQVRGQPMLYRSILGLPDATSWIVLAQKEDIERHPLESAIHDRVPNAIVRQVSNITSGQAATCLLAEDVIPKDAELLIASCDYEHRYNKQAWENIKDDQTVDVVVWTYRLGSMIVEDPRAFAYCEVDNSGSHVTNIAEKQTISNNPEKDPMVVGTFWYRRASDFFRSAKSLIDEDLRIAGEHYVGTSINQLIREGAKVVIFDVDQWISFGHPFELRVLQYWEEYFESKMYDAGSSIGS